MEETCLSPQNNQRFVATVLSQVRKPIYRGSSNDWENTDHLSKMF